jgi:uncharacterized membrane protein YoaK (UPF0700 family)
MFKPHARSGPPPIHYRQWFLLSGNAGFINAVAFLMIGTFATHVTGFATLFGVNVAKGDFNSAWTALFVPIFFVLGAFLGGHWVDVEITAKRVPRYDLAMGLSSLLLLAAAVLGEMKLLAARGTTMVLHEHGLLLSLICFSSGLQNAALTTSSGQAVRITHLTGLTTDLGRGLAQWLAHGHDQAARDKTLLRAGTILAFIGGSLLGAFGYAWWGSKAYGLSALICAYAAYQGHQAKALWTSTLIPAPGRSARARKSRKP